MKEKPLAPREPEPEECCGRGCTPCVYDLYEAALERYRAELRKAQAEDARSKAKPRSRT
jgi:hypothetical protein